VARGDGDSDGGNDKEDTTVEMGSRLVRGEVMAEVLHRLGPSPTGS
jgi:hypothetical protein